MSEGQGLKNPGERFIEILRQAGVGMDYRRIEEMLWLSRLLLEKELPIPKSVLPSAELIESESGQRDQISISSTSKSAPVPVRAPHRQRKTTRVEEVYMNRAAPGEEGLPASKVRVPMPSALPGSLEIMRSLRPFRRRIPSRQLKELDEEETVTRTAERGLLTPAYLPVKERWFDVAVVVEEKASMAIWQQPLLEFQRVLERLSAFREIRTHRLSLSESEPRLFTPAGQSQSLSTIADPYGRRLIFLLSDGVSAAWQNGQMAQALAVWSHTMPIVIVQMLSERMWHLTPLGKPSARVSTRFPGAANHNLEVMRLWETDSGARELPVPLVVLHPASLGRWARAVLDGSMDTPAVMLPEISDPANETQEETESLEDLNAEELFARYQYLVSPTAFRLAVYLSAVPLQIPIMRLVQRVMLPKSRLEHLSEFLLGGLVERKEKVETGAGIEEVEFTFRSDNAHNSVQKLLQREIRKGEMKQIYRSVAEYIEDRFGHPFDFFALIADQKGALRVPPEALPFTEIAAPLLRRFGITPRDARRFNLPAPSEEFFGWERYLQQLDAELDAGRRALCLAGTSGCGKTDLALGWAHRVKYRFPDGHFFLDLEGSTGEPWTTEATLTEIIRSFSPETTLSSSVPELRHLYRSVMRNERALLLLDDVGDLVDLDLLLPPENCLFLVTSQKPSIISGITTILIAPSFSPEKTGEHGPPQKSESQSSALRALINDALNERLDEASALNLAEGLREMAAIEVHRLMREAGVVESGGELIGTREFISGAIQHSVVKEIGELERDLNIVTDQIRTTIDTVQKMRLERQLHEIRAELESKYREYSGERRTPLQRDVVNPPTLKVTEDVRWLLLEAEKRCQIIKSPESIRNMIPNHVIDSRLIAETEKIAQFLRDASEASTPNVITLENNNQRLAALPTAADLHERFPDGVFYLDNRFQPISHNDVMWACISPFVKLRDNYSESKILLPNYFHDVLSQKRVVIILDHIDNIGEMKSLSPLPPGNALIVIGHVTAGLKLTRNALESKLNELRREYEQVITQYRRLATERDLSGIRVLQLKIDLETQRRSLLQDIRENELQLRALDRHPGKTLDELIQRALPTELLRFGRQRATIEGLISDLRRAESDQLQYSILLDIAKEFSQLNDYSTAIEFYEHALNKAIRDLDWQIGIFLLLGSCHSSLRNFVEAQDALLKALENAEVTGKERAQVLAHSEIGKLYRDQGEFSKAISHFEHQLSLAKLTQSRREEYYALVSLGDLFNKLGDFERGDASLETALDIVHSMPEDRGNEAELIFLLGESKRTQKRYEEARQLYHQSLLISIQLGHRHNEANAKEKLGLLAEAAGHREEAIQFAEQALEILTDLQSPDTDRVQQTLDRLRSHMIERSFTLTAFTFDTILLNEEGNEVKGSRRTLTARQFVERLAPNVTLDMVEISGGTFLMGTSDEDAVKEKEEIARYWNRDDAERWVYLQMPQHEVAVPPFYMGKFTITQAQWEAVMGSNPSHFKQLDLPVETIRWNEAQEFCKKLSEKTGRAYRLPSEAEWEYACRAGTQTPFAFGETITPQFVNYNGNKPYRRAFEGEYRQKTILPGSLGVANTFGLFDMHGNVWEWCEDVLHNNYSKAPQDGSAWLTGGDSSYRMVRGGSWSDVGYNCRSALRFSNRPSNRDSYIGFRVVVSARALDA